jgi:UDP-glucuronate 4-epimerase
MHVCKLLVSNGFQVIGLDNLNSYYELNLKYKRLESLQIDVGSIAYNKLVSSKNGFSFIELDLIDSGNLNTFIIKNEFDIIIHLAAQAGVRYSITNPRDYLNSNIIGFFNILESCRIHPIKHLIFASSSSVYGNSVDVPFKIVSNTDQPVSLYAASKKSNEVMAYSYSKLYNIPITGLRFFTVYGPYGRPDMAYFSFTKNIIEGKVIELFNNGDLSRDFTFIDDVSESIKRLIHYPPILNTDKVKFKLYNIGNQSPVKLRDFVSILEGLIKKKAIIINKDMQPGDVYITYSDTSELEEIIGFRPSIGIDEGLRQFYNWYKTIYLN